MKMEFIISKTNLAELTTSGEGEVGYLIMHKQSEDQLYSVSKIRVHDRGFPSRLGSALDMAIMEYVFMTPDVVGIPYKDIVEDNGKTDERTHFSTMMKFFNATQGQIDYFLTIKNKELKFFKISGRDGPDFTRVKYSIDDYNIASDPDRVREILIDSLKLGNPCAK